MEKIQKQHHTFDYQRNITGVLIALMFLISSCVTQSNLEYMQDRVFSQESRQEPEFSEYRLQANDALYIQINSLDDQASNIFSMSGTQMTLEPYSAYMNSYTIDAEGNIALPIVGKLQVTGKTLNEVKEMIQNEVDNILSLPMITVRLVNRYVDILGEVTSPGHYVYSQDKLTIFNAIGLAGDITEYGNRRKVTLVRNEEGQNRINELDLTKTDILASPYYFIQPNDLIYVSPLRKRIWGMREFPFTLIFSTITTGIVIYTFIQQQ